MGFIKKKEKIDQNILKIIFLDHWDGFKESRPRYDSDQYNEPVKKMLGCGEEYNGFSEYICMNCGLDKKRIAFSCKGTFCLSCAKQYSDDFVSTITEMLHVGVIYRHVVLTLPEQLRQHFYNERHKGDLLKRFMECGYECLEDVVSFVKRKKLKIGCIIVVQTHGRSGHYNPHLHVIMTGGGISEELGKWFDLGYLKYEIIHKKWQHHLLGMVKSYFGKEKVQNLVDELWEKYPNGFVANIEKGKVPESCSGLAKYLAKYVTSPPIAIRRIVEYDGKTVKYWYQDHKSKAKKFEHVDVYTFIGRMVQHIFPKWFQRVRYYGVQATRTYKKWMNIICEGIKQIRKVVKGAYQIVGKKKYRKRYQEISGVDPMKCRYCGGEMGLWKIWHPKYGVIYDEYENLKSGKYEEAEQTASRGSGHTRAKLNSEHRDWRD